jgi:methyl-accepting chemotaxis protein
VATLSVFLALGVFVSNYTNSMVETQSLDEMYKELDLLMASFDLFDRNITHNTQMLGKVFAGMFPNGIEIESGVTERLGGYNAPILRSGNEKLNLNFSKPDEFSRVTGGDATIFVRQGDDFLRISTSLKTKNGQRATGTLLGKNHPGYDRLINGQPYLGKAHLFGRDFMTQYKPVKDSAGQVIAILYVGFDFTDVFASLSSTLAETAVGETGYIFLVSIAKDKSSGTLIVHPQKAGKSTQALTAADGSTPFDHLFDSKKGDFSYIASDLGESERIVAFEHLPGWNMIAGMNVSLDEMTAASQELSIELYALMSLAAVLIVGLIFLILNRELTPLRRVSETLVRVGAGDLTQAVKPQQSETDVTGSSNNEIHMLQTSTRRMVHEFRNLVSGILESTDSLNHAASDLAQLTQESRQRLEDQRSRTDQVATAVTEMVASIQEVASNVATAAVTTKEATDKSTEGQATVCEAEHTIKDLAEQGEKAGQVIAELKGQSESIGSVIDVIKAIAEQTNLLALNAAIEAARAGDQGRGFAVVADEVRGLAQRTQKSISEIQDMIEGLQSEATIAVTHMNTSRDYSQQGVEKATAAAAALATIHASATNLSDMITQVASAAEEQTSVAEEININIVGIRDLSESTASSAEETAQASERLAKVAEDLKGRVERFQV